MAAPSSSSPNRGSFRWTVVAAGLGTVLAVTAVVMPLLAAVPGIALAAVIVLAWRRSNASDVGLQVEQLRRLGRAEVALAAAESFEDAAHELAEHAVALLGAASAVVLLESPDDTIRVAAGDPRSVYGDGSRMRLLEVDGVPCGSIAVGPRADGQPYTERDERILDALGHGVSLSLHRLSLLEGVRSEQQTLADVLASSSDGIFSAGPEHRIRSWNPAMEQITGLDSGEVLGEACCSVFRPLAADGTALFGSACPGRAGRETEPVPVRISSTNGDERWLTCTWSPMSDGGYVVVARDVTAAKRLEDQKAGFLARISHELRTPITPIQGFLDTLLRSEHRFSADDRARIYRLMLQQSQRLDRLVAQLLEATSLDDLIDSLLTQVVAWTPVVEEVVDQARRAAPDRQIELVVRRGTSKVVADERRAGQVLAHLLTNATTHTPEGTDVKVVVERREDEVVTWVLDHGEGIDGEDRERIFDSFTRLEPHLTQQHGGVGLGLYLARRYADAMGGALTVADAPGGGAAFRFSLPAATATRRSSPLRSRASRS